MQQTRASEFPEQGWKSASVTVQMTSVLLSERCQVFESGNHGLLRIILGNK
jgi:hypothetical protein